MADLTQAQGPVAAVERGEDGLEPTDHRARLAIFDGSHHLVTSGPSIFTDWSVHNKNSSAETAMH
jgi:hypothetical protein